MPWNVSCTQGTCISCAWTQNLVCLVSAIWTDTWRWDTECFDLVYASSGVISATILARQWLMIYRAVWTASLWKLQGLDWDRITPFCCGLVYASSGGHFSNQLSKTMVDNIDSCVDSFTLKAAGKIGLRQHHCILLFCCGLVYSSSGIISATTLVREWLIPFLASCPILPFYYILLWRFGHIKLMSNTTLQTKVVEGMWNKFTIIVRFDFSNLLGNFRFINQLSKTMVDAISLQLSHSSFLLHFVVEIWTQKTDEQYLFANKSCGRHLK